MSAPPATPTLAGAKTAPMAGPEPTQAELEASEWLVVLDSPVLPQAEIERFHAWLAASEENKRAWDDISSLWSKVGPVLAAMPAAEEAAPSLANDAGEPSPAASAPSSPPQPPGSRDFAARRWLTPAALVAGIAALALLAPILPAPAPRLSERAVAYATPAREPRTVELEDRSRVELSPLASADIAFSADERRVVLNHGVALFEVTPDSARPFIVGTPHGDVRVIGTVFAVRVSETSAVVTIVRGEVEAAPLPARSLAGRLLRGNGAARARAGEDICLEGGRATQTSLSPEALDQRLAWREGRIAGESMALGEAAAEITRFSGIAFDFADPRIARERVSVYLDGDDVDGFIALLAANLGLQTEAQADGRMLISRPAQRAQRRL